MRRLVCTSWDTATETCAVEAWEEEPASAFPPLSVEEAQTVGGAILLLWAVAWGVRMILRTLNQT